MASSDSTSTATPTAGTDPVEREIERRFNRRYVYGDELLPPTHYRASTTRQR